jgi:hypothetical protein
MRRAYWAEANAIICGAVRPVEVPGVLERDDEPDEDCVSEVVAVGRVAKESRDDEDEYELAEKVDEFDGLDDVEVTEGGVEVFLGGSLLGFAG